MAVCTTIVCSSCDQEKRVWHDSDKATPTTCSECEKKKAEVEKKAYLAAQAQLPMEERLAKLEEFMYDHQRAYHPSKLAVRHNLW